MPNGLDVSGMSAARGKVTKFFPLTSFIAEWARYQRHEHGEGGATKVPPLTGCNADGPDVSGMSTASGGGRSFHLLSAMPTGLHVSGMRTAMVR